MVLLLIPTQPHKGGDGAMSFQIQETILSQVHSQKGMRGEQGRIFILKKLHDGKSAKPLTYFLKQLGSARD